MTTGSDILPLRLVPIGRLGIHDEPVSELSDQGREVCGSMAEMYDQMGFVPPWIGYLGLTQGSVVGTCALTGAPKAGRVEIAYGTFPGREGRGDATGMAGLLAALAAATPAGVRVIAQTVPEETASAAVLRRLGFRLLGVVVHPQDGHVWEWHYSA